MRKFSEFRDDEIISQPLTPQHISYMLNEAFYFYSLEQKHQ